MKKEEEDLLRLKEILDSIGFEFFLAQGTLLGAIRGGTIIDYDNDFDLGTFEDLSDPSLQQILMDTFKKEGLKCQMRGPERNPRYPPYWALIEGFKWLVAMMSCRRTSDIVSMSTSPLRYPMKLFAELKEIAFLGTKFLVPYPPEDWLKFNYGKSWRTNAKRITIVKGSDPIEIYKVPSLEKVYLKCSPDGSFVYPLESIGPQLD